MSTEHPITPPPELVKRWYNECPEANEASLPFVATQAARWGADQELEACINEIYKGVGLRHVDYSSNRESLCSDIRAARRPKPTLKQQALDALDALPSPIGQVTAGRIDTIRRALEALPND